ncbi:MAG: polyprenyl synthetase family protein [Anaerolineales bacterium]|nr:polyprenyl synthetase family protein [Anaerolineales bacterium]
MNLSPVALVGEDIRSVEARIRALPVPPAAPVAAALERLLAAGGKRLRPALALLFGRMLHAPEEPLFHLAAALEIVHTATLIHDDLVDQARIRRGIPAIHTEWPAATAVLVGDFLFAWAAQLAAAAGSIAVVQEFAGALTVIVNGEIRELSVAEAEYSAAGYESRIRAKTAALFEVACRCPVLLTGDAAAAEQAAGFGTAFGMAFQIADDILDFTAESASTGKPSGQDLARGLLTLPAINYLASHPGDPDTSALGGGNSDTDIRSRLFEKIRASDAIEQSRASARRYIDRAVESLAPFPKGEYRDALENLVKSIV